MSDRQLSAMWARRRPAVMGILNITPDSFSDGGRFLDPEAAVAHGCEMVAAGADILDVGGESTRPGAGPVGADAEAERVVAVVTELARRCPDALVSVDTAKAAVAAAALAAGARMVNDVSAGRDPAMLALVAERGAAVVLMHMRGEPRTMQHDTAYANVVAEVHAFLAARAAAAVRAGIPRERVLLDPGIGFGKDAAGNLALLRALPDLAALGHPVVVGASRKSFIGAVTGAALGDRLPGSLAALAPAAALAAAVVRVHDVAATVQYLEVLAALAGAA
ncbi:MAG TPA: dihydropteroate synthase [Thermoanaerobaculaceae bacterium]|nr:dihydropteroate synthase [Thermoanaerobaculaceae bacterium]